MTLEKQIIENFLIMIIKLTIFIRKTMMEGKLI